jgi:hypothetical protein
MTDANFILMDASACLEQKAAKGICHDLSHSQKPFAAIIDGMDDEPQRRDDARSLRNLLVATAIVLTFPIWGSLAFYLL